MGSRDRAVLRELAERYMAVCRGDDQAEKRDAWRRHNSFEPTRPLIYVRAFAWGEMPECRFECRDRFFHAAEDFFRRMLFQSTVGDDFIFEPWVTVEAVRKTPAEGIWGLPVRWHDSGAAGGARRIDPPIREPEDIRRMVPAHHMVDEEQTRANAARLQEVIGDIIIVNVDRAPVYRVWNADISTQLIFLRGLDQVMYDMMDRPDWLHELLAFMRDGILTTHREAEQAGDWTLCDHQNQAMPYAKELRAPAANSEPVTRDRLWVFCASQEFTLVSPGMFDEFMVQYQLPIIREFGLAAYGCCEDLTHKIDVLRQIPNLRRIAVAPAADVAKCAEQIGTDYVLSYRPSPADMVSYGFDPDRIRTIMRRDLEACRGCCVDITLKDVETVERDPTRVPRWVEIARSVTEDCQ